MPESLQLHDQIVAMNEALMLGLVRQHELTDVADSLNVQLKAEIVERERIERALRESEERYRTLFELGPVAIYSCDLAGGIQTFNPRAAVLWGREPALGDTSERFCGSLRLFRPDGRLLPHDQCPMAAVVNGEETEVRDAEVQIERPDGVRIAVIANIRQLKDQHGQVTGAINCFYDITERKKAEDHQRFLMSELAHRGQNLLAVIQSIAFYSLPGTRPLAEERETLIQRIQAISRSQRALVSGDFEGASLAEVVRLGIEGFSDRITAVGPFVMLNRRIAQTFSLIIHELSTNAVKHGALSSANGRVGICWSIEGTATDPHFNFQWRERNGPSVVPPTRRSFGTHLLEDAAAADFGSPARITFASDGLVYEFEAALSILAQPGPRQMPPALLSLTEEVKR